LRRPGGRECVQGDARYACEMWMVWGALSLAARLQGAEMEEERGAAGRRKVLKDGDETVGRDTQKALGCCS